MTEEVSPGYQPSVFDTEPRPRWTPFSREMFQAGTLGRALFPDVLEGRLRPETTLLHPLTGLFHPGSKALGVLVADGLETCRDVLDQSDSKYTHIKDVAGKLSGFLKGLAVTPQGRLLEAVFGREQSSASIERESILVDDVNAAVATLIYPEGFKRTPQAVNAKRKVTVDPRFQDWLLIVRRFGLLNGIPHTLDEIGRIPEFGGITKETVRKIEARALRKLRVGSLKNLTTIK